MDLSWSSWFFGGKPPPRVVAFSPDSTKLTKFPHELQLGKRLDGRNHIGDSAITSIFEASNTERRYAVKIVKVPYNACDCHLHSSSSNPIRTTTPNVNAIG